MIEGRQYRAILRGILGPGPSIVEFDQAPESRLRACATIAVRSRECFVRFQQERFCFLVALQFQEAIAMIQLKFRIVLGVSLRALSPERSDLAE